MTKQFCISCGHEIQEDEEWCPEPCHTDFRDSNNRVSKEVEND
jgi:predicted nucleic acid-binding Zn ribbon protein